MNTRVKVFVLWVTSVFAATSIMLVVVSQTVTFAPPYQPPMVKTQEEMSQELVALLVDGGALNEAVEEVGGFASFLHDNEFDSSAVLMKPNTPEEMKEYTRQVRISIGQYMTEEEVKVFLELEELPPEAFEDFVDGRFLMPLSDKIFLGVLMGEFVLTSLNHFELANIPSESMEHIFFEVTLLPDLSKEDNWMTEVVLSGGIEALVSGGNEPYLNVGLIALRRSVEDRLLFTPEDFSYDRVITKDVKPLDHVLYLRSVAGAISHDDGTVINTSPERSIFTIGGRFSQDDLASPVFVLEDGESVWAGIIFIVNQEGDMATVLVAKDLKPTQEGDK